MKTINVLLVFLSFLFHSVCFAQFSPPGLGKINTATWFAVGVKQKLNDKKTISSATFLGVGRTSNPDNYNPLQRSAIYVVNQEITHHFAKHWEYAGALSYRLQNNYKTEKPYQLDSPGNQQEIRTYGKISYLDHWGLMDYSFTFRPELRFFFDPDFSTADKKAQFRTRFRGKIAFPLNASKTNKLIGTAEVLLATNKTQNWDQFQFNESRFCLYYSIKIPQQKITLNVGYMNDLLLKPVVHDAHYLAIDIAISDLFSS
ncbi:MAG TPA: DUF2490 domain-containing protein [Flavobacterium sp.]|nr:DUF2490 domain-containing protein [Flavobacterium sp.]